MKVHTYDSHTKSFNNNDEIEIEVNQKDIFMAIGEACLIVQGVLNTAEHKGTPRCQLKSKKFH